MEGLYTRKLKEIQEIKIISGTVSIHLEDYSTELTLCFDSKTRDSVFSEFASRKIA